MRQQGIRCNACGDEIFSKHRHDFRQCKCGLVAIDGGSDYMRITGEEKDYTILKGDNTKKVTPKVSPNGTRTRQGS